MAGKIIIIKPDDTIALADYNGYESLSNTVNGLIERFHSFYLPVDPFITGGAATLPVDLYCNEEFLINDSKEFDKINAVATLMSGKEIRGNAAMVVDNHDGSNRGFLYSETEIDGVVEENFCECWTAEDNLLLYINRNREHLQDLHNKFDGNKSAPFAQIISWGGKNKGEERD